MAQTEDPIKFYPQSSLSPDHLSSFNVLFNVLFYGHFFLVFLDWTLIFLILIDMCLLLCLFWLLFVLDTNRFFLLHPSYFDEYN